MNTLLEINGLYTSFGRDETEIKAVREVSLKIKKGETHALVGESGSGKSVTSLALMRLVEHGGGGSTAAAPIARDVMLQAIYGGEPPLEAYPTADRGRIAEQQKALRAIQPQADFSGKDQA